MQERVKGRTLDKDHCHLLCPSLIGDKCYLWKRDGQVATTLKSDSIGYLRTAACKAAEVKG